MDVDTLSGWDWQWLMCVVLNDASLHHKLGLQEQFNMSVNADARYQDFGLWQDLAAAHSVTG